MYLLMLYALAANPPQYIQQTQDRHPSLNEILGKCYQVSCPWHPACTIQFTGFQSRNIYVARLNGKTVQAQIVLANQDKLIAVYKGKSVSMLYFTPQSTRRHHGQITIEMLFGCTFQMIP